MSTPLTFYKAKSYIVLGYAFSLRRGAIFSKITL